MENKNLSVSEIFEISMAIVHWQNKALLTAITDFIKQTYPEKTKIFTDAYKKALIDIANSDLQITLEKYLGADYDIKDILDRFNSVG